LKPVINLYSAKIAYGQVAVRETSRPWIQALRMPNWVWLMMIFMAGAALALTTIARERTQLREAQARRAQATEQLSQTQAGNQKIRARVRSLKNDQRVYENTGQDRLNYVRPGEIVVAIR
jgi:cell division protein FtsB